MRGETAARGAVVLLSALAVGMALATSEEEGGPPEAAASSPVRLGFVYSTDTADLLEPLIEEFNERGFTESARAIVVSGRAIPSGQAETAITERSLQPVIWGPASSLWGRLLNHHAGADWAAPENPSIVESPQVIAMWEPLARALGYPDEPIGWNDLLALATDPEGWGSVGQPHYGAFKLGHTNPNSSTSGLSAVAAMYRAVAGGLTTEHLEPPAVRAAVREIQQSIVHYGETADEFLEQMERYGPDYAHAVAVQETSLVQFNEDREADRLVAVYPAEGTFVADYPFIVLRAPWVDEAEQRAAETFGDWLLPRITPELAATDAYRKPGVHQTLAPVDRAHGADPDQPAATLPFPAPEVIARIQAEWNADRKPANIALVVDTSRSLGRAGRLGRQQEALSAFLDELRAEDRVGLVTFGSDVFEPVPVAPLAEGEEELRRTIGDLISGGSSSLYDGVRRGFETIRALDDGSRINAVIVVADGADDGSSATLDELAEELAGACDVEGAVIPVITVAYGPEADREALARIAGTCQGRALTASPDDEAEDDVVDVFRRIALLF